MPKYGLPAWYTERGTGILYKRNNNLANRRGALLWWKKSIDECERLGARLALSGTYFEVGKRMFTGTSPTPTLPLNKGEGAGGGRGIVKRLGLSPEECLEKAETMFREMDLQWDLAELAKVRSSMVKNS